MWFELHWKPLDPELSSTVLRRILNIFQLQVHLAWRYTCMDKWLLLWLLLRDIWLQVRSVRWWFRGTQRQQVHGKWTLLFSVTLLRAVRLPAFGKCTNSLWAFIYGKDGFYKEDNLSSLSGVYVLLFLLLPQQTRVLNLLMCSVLDEPFARKILWSASPTNLKPFYLF